MSYKALAAKLIEQGIIDHSLWEFTLDCTSKVLKESANSDPCKELASDFLLHVRAKNLIQIFQNDNFAGKRCVAAIRLFNTEKNLPVNKELWDLLSQGLHKGGKSKLFRRLLKDRAEPNDNKAIWTAAPPEYDNKTLNLYVFTRKAKRIGVYYPKKQKNKESRIITPKDAFELVKKLLDAANGPIQMNFLFDEAINHVCTSFQYEEDKKTSFSYERGQDDITLELYREQFWHEDKFPLYRAELTDEAKPRSERIWQQLLEIEGNKLLCLYFLPVYYLGKDLNQNQFGIPQRISEKEQEIRKIMAKELYFERLSIHEVGNIFERFLYRVIRLVAERLKKKCAEKGWNENLS